MIRELHITDDRGVERPVHADDVLAGEAWNASRSAASSEGKPGAVHQSFGKRWGSRVVLLCVISFWIVEIIRAFVSSRMFDSLIPLLVILGVLLIVERYFGNNIHSFFWRRRFRRNSGDAVRQHARISMARGLRCPCCAYGLADTPAGSDGCTPCPECGAAWRLNLRADDPGTYRQPAITAAGEGHKKSRTAAPDARGVVVPLLARRKSIDRQENFRASPALPKRVHRRVFLLGWAAYLAIIGGIVWAFAAIAEPQHFLAWMGAATAMILLAMVAAVPVWVAYYRQLAFATHPYFIRAMVGDGICPCCESPLRVTPSPIDGYLLCDTCGSAWNPPDSQPRA